MAHTNHSDANTNEHGVVDYSRKGYCMLYFAMFLFCLLGAIIYVYTRNGDNLPNIAQ